GAAGERLAVDLERRLRGRVHGESAVVAVEMAPRANRDRVLARRDVDVEQRAADAELLLLDRRDRGHDVWPRGHDRRSGRRVDLVRRGEVEIDRQQRGAAAGDDQVIRIREPDLDLDDAERLPGLVDDLRGDDVAAGLDEDFRVAVGESERAAG